MSEKHSHPLTEELNQQSMLWLLAAQIVILLPLITFVPLTVVLLQIVTFIFRWQQLKKGIKPLGNFVKLILIGLTVGALLVFKQLHFDLNSMVALALSGLALKNLEAHNQRDGFVVILAGYFMIGSGLLLSQSMLVTLLVIICLSLLTTIQIAIQQLPGQSIKQQLRISNGMLLLCLPLMLFLFLFFPRLPPLWSVPSPDGKAVTGLSDSFSLGGIAELAQSNEVAFRASFSGAQPRQDQLYWRAMTLANFDGQTWEQLKSAPVQKLSVLKDPSGLNYEVFLKNPNQKWLLSLDMPTNFDNQQIEMLSIDGTLKKKRSIDVLPYYQLSSSRKIEYTDSQAFERLKQFYIQMPTGENPSTVNLSNSLWKQAQGDTKGEKQQDFINVVLAYFNQEPYFYSLRPGKMPNSDQIDYFLFASKKGFCGHYASSFTMLMRAQGVPTRIVSGYLGGQYVAQDNYWLVKQKEAHAWTEVWIDQLGWQRVDPTAAVAPNRIEQGVEQSVAASEIPLQWSVMKAVQLRLDRMQFYWQKWVVNFDSDQQESFFGQFIGQITTGKMLQIAMGFMATIGVLWWWLLKPKPLPKAYQPMGLFYDGLTRKGLVFDHGVSINKLGRLAIMQWPLNEMDIRDLVESLNNHYYEKNSQWQRYKLTQKVKSLLRKLSKLK